MQLLITLKGIEDLSRHLPSDANPKELVWKRLWDFNDVVLEELGKSDDPEVILECIYAQMSFDLQCLYKTFEVTVGQGINAQQLANYWKQHKAVLLVEFED